MTDVVVNEAGCSSGFAGLYGTMRNRFQ